MSAGTKLPADVANNPRLSLWVRIAADGGIEINTGKVELGQGIRIAQLQIAADELDVPLESIRLCAGDTGCCPDQGMTAGSLSVEAGGMALRQICAEVRLLFVEEAARRLTIDPKSVRVAGGRFSAAAGGESLSYLDLASAVDLDRDADGAARPKPSSARGISGTSAMRPDLAQKLFGAGYIQDLELPNMLHGRVVRPPSYAARLVGFDAAARQAIERLPGVHTVLVDGRYIGVCAEREEQAITAADAIRKAAVWEEGESLPQDAPDQHWLRALSAEDSVVLESGDGAGGRDDGTGEGGLRCIEVDYSRPFLAHGSIGPSCGLAHWEGGGLTVWTHAQGSFPLRRELAQHFGVDVDRITVIHSDGAGCYGHNGADDAALDAAVLARAAGRPVRLQWMRDDEFAWEPYGSAMSMRIAAGLDAQGRIARWHHQTWSQTHVQRPGNGPWLYCLAGAHRDPPAPTPPLRDFPLPAGGGQRNAVPIYALPSRKIEYHLIKTPSLRTSALRALGGYANVFAIESCMDELALLAGRDPLAFRLDHLADPRAVEVLQAVAQASGWHRPKEPACRKDAVRGRGIGFARYKNTGAYCAVVVEIEVAERIILDRVWAAVDAGEVINPDGLVNQLEGGVLQSASWTLKEAVHWDRVRVTTRSWEDYPVLGFGELPRELSVHIVPRPDAPPLGAGECAAGPTAAAIANALADAVGVRVRDLPLTPDRLERAAHSD